MALIEHLATQKKKRNPLLQEGGNHPTITHVRQRKGIQVKSVSFGVWQICA